MKDFLFRALDKNGKAITQKIDAMDLEEARLTLENRGYEEIEFLSDNIRNDIQELYSESLKERLKDSPAYIEADWGGWLPLRFVINVLKSAPFSFLVIAASVGLVAFLFKSYLIPLGAILFFILFFLYFMASPLLLGAISNAAIWARWGKVRRLTWFERIFNWVSPVKHPAFLRDSQLAKADAAEGRIEKAFLRMEPYENDPKVSTYLYYSALYAIFDRSPEKKLEYIKLAIEADENQPATLIDYALCIAADFKDIEKARSIMENASSLEMIDLHKPHFSYAMGVLEFLDNNYEKAEFHFEKVSADIPSRLTPMPFIPINLLSKAYLARLAARKGEREKAEALYSEALPFLKAHNMEELIGECQKMLA